jgi:hypothetical protein
MLTMSAYAVVRYGVPSLDGLSNHFGFDVRWITPLVKAAGLIIYPTVAWSLWTTYLFIAQEVRNYKPRNIPKLIYVASIAAILSTGFYSAVVVFCVFAISHSVEYVAFLSVYAKHRAPLREWIKTPVAVNLVCLPGALALLLSLHLGSPLYFFTYAIFHTYLHVVFDAYIWRVREAPIRQAIMAIGTAK